MIKRKNRLYRKNYYFKSIIVLVLLFISIIGIVLSIKLTHNSKNSVSSSSEKTNSPQPKENVSTPKPVAVINSFEVPILEYHYIRDPDALPSTDKVGKNLSVSAQDFESQLAWLQSNNYESIKVSDIVDTNRIAIQRVLSDNKKPIVLSFDDGYYDAYSAVFPLLQKYNFIGVFYIIRDFVGRPLYMTQSQIDSLSAANMEIGSHTLSHIDLGKASLVDARHQIFDSKNNATTFCYPSGKHNDSTISLLKEAGYTSAVSEISGIANQDSNAYLLPRVRVQSFSGEILGKTLNRMEESTNKTKL